MRTLMPRLDKAAVQRWPLTLEANWTLKYLFGSERPYAGRWDRLRAWLAEVDQVLGPNPPPPSRRLLFFSVLPYWVDFSLAIAAMLAAKDCAIDFAWWPYDDFMPPQRGTQAYRYERWSGLMPRPRGRFHPRLTLMPLEKLCYHAPATPAMREAAERVSDYDTRYATRRERLVLEGDPEAQALYRFRLDRNLTTMQALATLLDSGQYDAMITPNGGTLEFGAAYELARLRGLPCVTFEAHEARKRIIASQTLPVIEFDTTPEWNADEPHFLDPARAARVDARLRRRELPDWGEEYIWSGQRVPPPGAAEQYRQLGLRPDRPLVLMATNIAWDSAVLGRTRTFPSMADWVLTTIDWFAKHPDFQVVVRCHPAEVAFPSNEPVPEMIAEWYPTLPPNVRVVAPGDPVNTYGLMALCEFALVYTSTVGLECATRGIPAIVAGRTHYEGKGFSLDPANPTEYLALLDQAAAGSPPGRLTPKQIEMARCYFDIFYESWPKAFPWSSNLPADELTEWPIRRIFSPEGLAQYGRTLNFLAGQ